MKLRKATDAERRQYTESNPVNPLFAYVKTGAYIIPVEYLGEGAGEPNYEAVLPPRLIFVPDYTHTLLGTTQADLLERLRGNDIKPCSLAGCCGNPIAPKDE